MIARPGKPPHPGPLPHTGRGGMMTESRRTFLRGGIAASLALLTGCGWEPLYADRVAGPADAELAAIKVAPIPERVGQILALRLRQWLNPTGAEIPSRYLLRTVLVVSRADLGVLTSGLGTRAQINMYAGFTLVEI